VEVYVSAPDINFGIQVRSIRKKLNISQEKLAELASIDIAHMGI
jgi:transcriptional regulator with XRE-family HTH domain